MNTRYFSLFKVTTLDPSPINSKSLGIDEEMVLSALIKSKEIRPQRVTILDKSTKEQIEKAALATGVVG